jgi:hypothetical protein
MAEPPGMLIHRPEQASLLIERQRVVCLVLCFPGCEDRGICDHPFFCLLTTGRYTAYVLIAKEKAGASAFMAVQPNERRM